MYTIEVLNSYNNDKFKQLKSLIKKFAIDVFIMQKFNIANDSYNKKIEYINNYKKYLSDDELEFLKRDIKDPWYTGNFNETYEDIMIGLNGFYDYLLKNKLHKI